MTTKLLQTALRRAQDKRKKNKDNGFTLVELLIVVVILGILSGVALPNFLAQRDRARVGAANAASAAFITACEVAITNDEDLPTEADADGDDVARLWANLPDDDQATAEATVAAGTCSVDVTGTFVAEDGDFNAFGAKIPAIAGEPPENNPI